MVAIRFDSAGTVICPSSSSTTCVAPDCEVAGTEPEPEEVAGPPAPQAVSVSSAASARADREVPISRRAMGGP